MNSIDHWDLDCRHVVILDKEREEKSALETILKNMNLTVGQADDLEEAITQMEETETSLLLCRLADTHEVNKESITKIREEFSTTAILMLTREHEVAPALDYLAHGAWDYVHGPFRDGEIEAHVRRVLGHRWLVRQEIIEETRRDQAFVGGVTALINAMEAKDSYTLGHSVRVGQLSALIGEEMGWSPEDCEELRLGGRLHDIGKLGVRDEILNKAGALTDAEYAHVMTHAMVGWTILQPMIEEHPMALNMVRWHHERMDGGGGPDRLAGEAIPLEARIAAAADVWDAMRSERPYTPRKTREKATKIIKLIEGSHLDPVVVKALLAILEKAPEMGPSAI